jgi:hypothetical protein
MHPAYFRTEYEAAGIVVRISQRSAAMDALLRAHRVRGAAFVTAWNPFSRRMPRGWNDRMQARLRHVARGRVLAEGWGSARGWREAHLLVAAAPRRITRVARRFRQNAVVIVAVGQRSRLVATR